jgi:hypothetical protein
LGVSHDIPESESSEVGVEEIVEGYDKWRNISGDDISVVMRKRAEEGYGLGNVRYIYRYDESRLIYLAPAKRRDRSKISRLGSVGYLGRSGP